MTLLPDLKVTPISIGEYVEDLQTDRRDIAKFNRPFEWTAKDPLEYAQLLIDGYLVTAILVWEQNPRVHHEYVVFTNLQASDPEKKIMVLHSVVIDGGHRTACLYSWFTGSPVNISNGDFKGRGKDIGIAFSPLYRRFEYIHKIEKLSDEEKCLWIYPMSRVWRELIDVPENVYEQRTEEEFQMFREGGPQASYNTVFETWSKDQLHCIESNIKDLVRIPSRKLTIITLPARASKEEVLASFLSANKNKAISVVRKFMCRLITMLPDVFDDYHSFYEKHYNTFLLESETNLPAIAATISTHELSKDDAVFEKLLNLDNIPEFKAISSVLLDSNAFTNFQSHVANYWGMTDARTRPSAKLIALHCVESAYYYGLYNYPSIRKSEFFSALRKMFFSAVILPRQFKDNWADQMKKFFSRLKDINSVDAYMNFTIDFTDKKLFEPNTANLFNNLMTPAQTDKGKIKNQSGHPFIKVERAIMYADNSPVIFYPNANFVNIAFDVQHDHVFPTEGVYTQVAKEVTKKTEHPMNIVFMPSERNNKKNTNKPSGYFDIWMAEMHNEADYPMLLKANCLDVEVDWKSRTSRVTVDLMEEFYVARAHKWVKRVNESYKKA